MARSLRSSLMTILFSFVCTFGFFGSAGNTTGFHGVWAGWVMALAGVNLGRQSMKR